MFGSLGSAGWRGPWASAYFIVFLLVASVVASAAAEPPEALPQPVDRCPFTGRFPVEIVTASPFECQALQAWDLDIDDVRGTVIEAYVDDAQFEALRKAGYQVEAVPNQARRAWAEAQANPTREAYHTYVTLTDELALIHADHPEITELFSIGTSVQGRELWVLKISDNAALDEPEPEFKFSATIHGDEPPGTEMCVYLIRLLTQSYGTDPEITGLVDDLEIYICPLHNPDGRSNGTRYNAEGYDLNRSFPDPRTDPVDSPVGRPTEVRHMMNFATPRNFVLGANYHTGALVMNYPWDTWYGVYTPDDDLFVDICLGYSYLNPPMWNSGSFENGITIGWDWYVISGGLQDWSYEWRNELHVTIEMSNTKWPSTTALPGLWENNRGAMLYYMAQARVGVEGFVTDAVNGNPINATIEVLEIGKNIHGEPEYGYYHRMLLPGIFTLRFSAPGYLTHTENDVVVVEGTTSHLNVQLARDPAAWSTVSGTVTEVGSGEPLGATISVFVSGSAEVFDATSSDPLTGAYTIEVPNAECDFTAEAGNHEPDTETRLISTDTTIDFALVYVPSAVASIPGEIRLLALERPRPTPTGGAAAFRLLMPEAGTVEVGVYDAAGRRIRGLVDGPLSGGGHLLRWDGQDEAGRHVGPGVYYVKAVSPGGTARQRLVVVR